MNNSQLIRNDLRIVRLNEADAIGLSDHFIDLKELVLSNEDMYPNIDKWFDSKVIPGLKKYNPSLKTYERSAFVGYFNEKPIISAIVKKGKFSKFCHLRINDDFQNNNLGEIFFSLMAYEVHNTAKEIHFTLPESLWNNKKEFFQSFGFQDITKSGTQYRIFDMELRCSSSFSNVWTAVLDKLPKLKDELIMSIHPEYAKKILEGKKTVEIRRKFSKKWKGFKVKLYSTSPIKSLIGEAIIDDIVIGKPDFVWERFGTCISITKEEFDKYVKSANEIYAIVLNDVHPFKIEIPLSQISHLTNSDLKPPQSYCNLKNNKSWSKAVSIATLLQANFRNSIIHTNI
jgi:predicted transcriptional regulator